MNAHVKDVTCGAGCVACEAEFENMMAGESCVSADDDYDEALTPAVEDATSDDDIARMLPLRFDVLHWLFDSHRFHGHGAHS